ncbi:MAG TPA: hypothetical protein VF902_09375, partial [Coriobacteriia bacterium]
DSRAYLIDQDGYVTVYRGVPGAFAGVSLHWLVARTDVPVASLDLPVATRLKEGLAFDGVDAALRRVVELRSTLPSASPDATSTGQAPTSTVPTGTTSP